MSNRKQQLFVNMQKTLSHTVYTAHMKQTYMLCVTPTWCMKRPAHRHEDAIAKNILTV